MAEFGDIHFNRIPVADPDITAEDVLAVHDVVRSGWISGISPKVREFEDAFAEWVGVKHAVATGSGTTAGHLAMASLELQPGDEVILPSFTMIASANVCHYLGLKLVFVDCLPDTWCIDPKRVEAAITDRTRAIMAVHLYGHPCDMGALQKIAFDNDLRLVEDAAEAHGATWKRKRTGSLGDIGFFSFYANKIITTGEGGMITTDDVDLAERARWLRAHAFGRHGKHYYHEEVGYGYRMSGMQAALGLSQLQRIFSYTQKRRYSAWRYKGKLGNLKLQGKISFPTEAKHCENVYWMFSILLEDWPTDRATLIKNLADRGIETRTFFYPLHQMPPYATPPQIYGDEFPVTEDIAARGINLPSGNTLNEKQIDYICEVLRELAEAE